MTHIRNLIMGNSAGGLGLPDERVAERARVTHYFSPQSWIEGAALKQLDQAAGLAGVTAIAAFPDLHPGKYGPTGMALAATRLHPQLIGNDIGNDIGCGMSLFELDLPPHRLKLDRATEAMRRFEEHEIDAEDALAEAGLAPDLYPTSLGSIGGGNHFCELQAVESTEEAAIDRKSLYLLVHSGSRGLGAAVFGDFLRDGLSMADGLDPASSAAANWLRRHDECVAWASLNRRLIGGRAASALRCEARLVTDIPHNLVRASDAAFVHHKGAAAVGAGELAPIAGSRASLSYVVRATDGITASLGGISHGAGRKYDRATMHGRVGRTRSERDALLRDEWGGQLICDDRGLVIEEAASAYKDAGQVVADLAAAGLVETVAAMKPLITYKKVVEGQADQFRGKPHRGRGEGRRRHDRH